MASKRMFSNAVIDRDDFCMLSIQAQLLYFHLGMKADDDGFVQTMKICRMLDFDENPLEELAATGFIIRFPDEKAIVITHWNLNNELKKDRYHGTQYQGLKNRLRLDENKTYRIMETEWNQNGTAEDTEEAQRSVAQPSVEKPSVAQPSAGEGSPEGGDLRTAQQSAAGFLLERLEKVGIPATEEQRHKIEALIVSKGTGAASDYVERLMK